MKRKQRGDIELTQTKAQPKRDERAAKKRKTAAVTKAAPAKRKPAKKAAPVESEEESFICKIWNGRNGNEQSGSAEPSEVFLHGAIDTLRVAGSTTSSNETEKKSLSSY